MKPSVQTDRFQLRIDTPEGISFALTLASPVIRFLSWLIDLLCVLGITLLINSALSLLNLLSADVAGAATMIAFFLISIGYPIVLEWWTRGQTVGKRILRLRVMDASGMRLQFNQVMMRNLLRTVDFFPICYLLGGAVAAVSRRGQRLGDLAAGTVVVWQPTLTEPDVSALLPDRYNSLRARPHLAARLRQLVTPEEAMLAVGALMRREQLEASARVSLFAALAGHFKRRVAFPDEDLVGVSDEQYIRNVVDVLYRASRDIPSSS